jgi:hypothetical protein
MKIHEVLGEPCAAVSTGELRDATNDGDPCAFCPRRFRQCLAACEAIDPAVSTVFVRVPDFVALQLQGHYLETF